MTILPLGSRFLLLSLVELWGQELVNELSLRLLLLGLLLFLLFMQMLEFVVTFSYLCEVANSREHLLRWVMLTKSSTFKWQDLRR
jgi:hypothetical protein